MALWREPWNEGKMYSFFSILWRKSERSTGGRIEEATGSQSWGKYTKPSHK
jgi:hypothetical protein